MEKESKLEKICKFAHEAEFSKKMLCEIDTAIHCKKYKDYKKCKYYVLVTNLKEKDLSYIYLED